MTNEEAIKSLNTLRESINGVFDYNCRNQCTALDMAIKALERKSILDKLRAEIAEIQLIGYATVDGKREIASRAVLQIIDKYKESEEK